MQTTAHEGLRLESAYSTGIPVGTKINAFQLAMFAFQEGNEASRAEFLTVADPSAADNSSVFGVVQIDAKAGAYTQVQIRGQVRVRSGAAFTPTGTGATPQLLGVGANGTVVPFTTGAVVGFMPGQTDPVELNEFMQIQLYGPEARIGVGGILGGGTTTPPTAGAFVPGGTVPSPLTPTSNQFPFAVNDWLPEGPSSEQVVTVPFSAHGIDSVSVIEVFEDVNGVYVQTDEVIASFNPVSKAVKLEIPAAPAGVPFVGYVALA